MIPRTGSWLAAILVVLAVGPVARATTLDLDFNSGLGNNGNLVYSGAGGFQVTFTDDDSTGTGGNAAGVHVTNENYGNRFVGSSTNFVLGAYNTYNGAYNYHTSGIVGTFNFGASLVSLLDADDDTTVKSLFAFDQAGGLIGTVTPGTQQGTVTIGTANTGGQLIWKVEFDTQAGTAGGAADGTYFTIDDFHVEYAAVPEPSALLALGLAAAPLLRLRARRRPGR